MKAMNNNIKLNASEIIILKKLARRSKMNCWLSIDEDGNIYDLENNPRKMSIKKNAIKQFIEGLTAWDIEILDSIEMIILLQLLGRMC